MRTFEPEQVTQPPGGDQREWLFGIRTEPDDVQKPWATTSTSARTPATARRCRQSRSPTSAATSSAGSSAASPTSRSTPWIRSTSPAGCACALGEGAAEQAAIVSVMQYETGTQQEVQAFLDGDADFQELDPLTQTLQDVKRQKKGSHLHIPKGQQYASPPNAQNGNTHLAILSMCIRGAGVRWNAPEWLGSADASNTNYASSLTAESPFVRTVRRRQRAYGAASRRTWWAVLRNWCERRGGIKAGGVLLLPGRTCRGISTSTLNRRARETRSRAGGGSTRGWDENNAGSAEPAAIRQEQGRDWEQIQQTTTSTPKSRPSSNRPSNPRHPTQVERLTPASRRAPTPAPTCRRPTRRRARA